MIDLLQTLVTVWICGIPLALIGLGAVYGIAPRSIRPALRQSSYVFWCVAWPFALARVVGISRHSWRIR